MVVLGETVVEANKVVKAASEYHLSVSAEQLADKVEELPLQILDGEAAIPVGVGGVGVTLIVTLALVLLQAPETQAA